MSEKSMRHFADPKGAIIESSVNGTTLFAAGNTVPADATAGYQPGCIFIDEDATSPGLMLWVNLGTNASCLFRPFVPFGNAYMPLIAAGSSLTLTANAHRGRTIALDTAAGSTVTLPAASGSGNVYNFLVTVLATSNSHIVKVANGSDAFDGFAFSRDDTSDNAVSFFAVAGTDDTVTLNRTTTGSVVIGERIAVTDVATNRFHVEAFIANSGTPATPFSATV